MSGQLKIKIAIFIYSICLIFLLQGCNNDYDKFDIDSPELYKHYSQLKAFFKANPDTLYISGFTFENDSVRTWMGELDDNDLEIHKEVFKKLYRKYGISSLSYSESLDVLLLNFSIDPNPEWFEINHLIDKKEFDKLISEQHRIVHENEFFYVIDPYGEFDFVDYDYYKTE